MTRLDRHRIQRQVIELVVGAGAQTPALQEALARSLRDRTLTELEGVFDAAAGAQELLRLDRLEIDLGTISGADWEPQFRSRLVAELTRSLAHLKPVQRAQQAGTAGGDAAAGDMLQQFLFFLVHGRLPWWGARPGRAWGEALDGAMDAAAWDALHATVLADDRARVRLVDAVGDDFLEAAVVHWSRLPHAAGVLARITPAGLPAEALARWRRQAWTAVLEWVLAGRFRAGRGPQLLRDLLVLGRPQAARDAGEPFAALSRDEAEPAPWTAATPADDLPQPWQDWLRTLRDGPPPGAGTPREVTAHAVVRAWPAPSPRAGSDAARPAPVPAADDAVYLDGAGAILLHPFLEQLFRASGLLAGRDFRDAGARDRGVRLLGLLAGGSADLPEYALLLPKLLCGCPFEEPLEPAVLDDEDRARCDALLRAVLGHWTALRSSSPRWLREQFFLREGKLEHVDDGMRLTVERRAQDVLLARLPWGIGVIGLPWLRQRIFVHWLD